MNELVMHPTGTCFDDALDYLEILAKRGEIDACTTRFKLCHGICLDSEGKEYAHAWVEEGPKRPLPGEPTFAWGCGFLSGRRGYYQAHRDDFYQEFRVQEVRRYSVHEALLENHKSGNYGPWLPEYRALCKPRPH